MPSGDRKLRMEELDRPAPAVNFAAPKRPLIVLLEDVRSRHNVGSIFRTADAFGAERVILCGYTPKPPHREIEKTRLYSLVRRADPQCYLLERDQKRYNTDRGRIRK